MGFCFYNNDAVAIKSLRKRYADGPNAFKTQKEKDLSTATANDESYFSPSSVTTSASSLRAPSCTGAAAGGAGVGTTTTASVRETRSRTRLALQSSMNRPLSRTGGAAASASMGTGSGSAARARHLLLPQSTSSATVPGLGVGVGVGVGRVKAQAEALESSAQPQTCSTSRARLRSAPLRSVDGGSGSPTKGGVARPAPPERQDSTSSIVSSTGSCAAASSKTRAAAKEVPASKIRCFEVEDTGGIKAYLRIRPAPHKDKDYAEPYIQVLNETQLLIRPPREGVSSSIRARMHASSLPTKYTFPRVFAPSIPADLTSPALSTPKASSNAATSPTNDQASFFQHTNLPLVRNLLSGESGLIFTYGVTNSGKSYTVLGGARKNEAGILPRALNVVFNSIQGRQLEDARIRPRGLTNVPTSKGDKVAADPVARQHPSVGPRQDEPGRQVISLPDATDAMLSWTVYEAYHGVVDIALPTLLSLALQSSRQKDVYSGRVDPKLSRTGAKYLERLERKIDALLLYVWDNCIRACPGPSAASSSALASSGSPISNGIVSTRPALSITGGPKIGAGPDVLVGHGPGCAAVLRLISRRALRLSQTLAKQQLAQSSEQMKMPIVRAVEQNYGHEDLAQVPKHVPPASTGSVGTSAGLASAATVVQDASRPGGVGLRIAAQRLGPPDDRSSADVVRTRTVHQFGHHSDDAGARAGRVRSDGRCDDDAAGGGGSSWDGRDGGWRAVEGTANGGAAGDISKRANETDSLKLLSYALPGIVAFIEERVISVDPAPGTTTDSLRSVLARDGHFSTELSLGSNAGSGPCKTSSARK
ncbi:hypothetical protein OC842_000270 [Tilletia horrida]|uniref:Kinesin motor domain-containing protein n=1 Tax=Tilletia horrida TaxID=155126 RepID=A0AAN6GK59_9BASI|nr:hypothetical protein OC842_000270 [Tilletia horrida]